MVSVQSFPDACNQHINQITHPRLDPPQRVRPTLVDEDADALHPVPLEAPCQRRVTERVHCLHGKPAPRCLLQEQAEHSQPLVLAIYDVMQAGQLWVVGRNRAGSDDARVPEERLEAGKAGELHG